MGEQLLHAALCAWNDCSAAQAHRRLLHGLLADPSSSAVVCGLVVVGFPSGAVCFVVFACLSRKRKGSGGFFLTCFWASLERSQVTLVSNKWGRVW